MNFSKINYQSILGKVLRLPLRLIPKRMVMRIIQGRLRGKKWVVGAGEHGYWLGSYELQKRLAFEKEITSGSVIYDIGANVGYFSLLASILTDSEGSVYAFEPLPRNVEFLRKHVALNHLGNINIIQAAVSDQEGESNFGLGASTAMGHLSLSGEIKVNLVCLDQMLGEGKLKPPDYMKVDVEGAEYQVLCGAFEILSTHKPIIFLDTHNRDAHDASLSLLSQLGYQFTILDGRTLAETRELIAFPNRDRMG